MATVSFTTTTYSQALHGQSVRVYVSASDQSKLSTIAVGQLCTIGSNSKTGTVASVDNYGYSFLVTPISPEKEFSSQAGYLAISQTINVTTP